MTPNEARALAEYALLHPTLPVEIPGTQYELIGTGFRRKSDLRVCRVSVNPYADDLDRKDDIQCLSYFLLLAVHAPDIFKRAWNDAVCRTLYIVSKCS